MLLDRINSPSDLRRLDEVALDQLAAEIRQVIVDRVNENGGHLGSNLGAVELTLALHRVFDSPRDTILWDTGHQAYVHKLVTGRRDDFPTLRRQGGLSGYPSRAESAHDIVENSHASTVLSYAHGLATAQEMQGEERRHVVAVIGDGALTGGMAYEGLNNLGHSGRDVIIVLNDNGRSYAPTVSRLSDSLSKLRANPTYRRQQARVERLVEEVPVVGPYLERTLDGAKAALRVMFEPPAFFEDLGVGYLGPLDGHDIEGLETRADQRLEDGRARRRARAHPEGPRLRAGGERRREDDARHVGHHEGLVHRRLLRGDGGRGRSPTRVGRHHRGHAGLHRPAALRRDLPRPPHRRRHRRAARGDVRGGDGDGRTATGRRGLLDLPDPGLRPGQPRRRPAPAAGRVRVRPRRDDRRRRSVAPRPARHGAPHQGAAHDGVRPVELRGGRPDAPRRARAVPRRARR